MKQNKVPYERVCWVVLMLTAWVWSTGLAANSIISLPSKPSSGPTRVIHFPPDQSLGILYVEPEGYQSMDPMYVGLRNEEWEYLGEAQGDMKVPANRSIQLRVILRLKPEDRSRLRSGGSRMLSDQCFVGLDDLSGLSSIGPNDLTRITISAPALMKYANERVLEPLSHMTGLQMLELNDTGMTNKGMLYLRKLRSLKSLVLSENRVSGTGLAVLQDLPHLKYLDCEIGATDVDLKVLGQISSLRWLRIRMGRIRGPGLAELVHLPHLERLCLAGRTGLSDRHIRYLQSLTNLKGLTLRGTNYPLTDTSLAFIGKLASLEELYFINIATNFTAAGHARLTNLKHLKKLEIATISDARFLAALPQLESIKSVTLTADNMKALSSLRSLKSLNVSMNSLPDGKTEDLAAASCLGNLTSLEELHFVGMAAGRHLSDSEVACLESLNHLKKLSIGMGGDHLTDRSVKSISRLRQLESLVFFSSATKTGLNQLNNLTNLQSLDLNVSNSTLKPGDELSLNLNKLTNLTSLKLGCSSLKDDDLTFLSQLPRLQVLGMSSRSLPGSTLERLGNMSELKYLHLMEISRATKEDMAHLAGLTELRNVTFMGKLSDAALKHLPCLPSVWSLSIYSEERIDPETRDLLQERMPALKYIHFRRFNPDMFKSPSKRSIKQNIIRFKPRATKRRTPKTRRYRK